MKNTLEAGFVLFLAMFAPIGAFSAAQKSSTQTYLDQLHSQGKERVVVIFDNQADSALLNKYDANLIHNLKVINALVCIVNREDIELLKQAEGVEDVVPDMVVKMNPTPQPELKTPAMTTLSFDGLAAVRWNNLEAGLNSIGAWDNYDLDGSGITIAFLDTGVNYTMENIDDNYLGGADFVDGDGDPLTTDVDENHGTKVISLAVGEGVNKVVGVAYNASYYAVRVLDETGVGFVSDFISGIEWASTEPHKADIISMSFGIYDSPMTTHLRTACDTAFSAGVILISGSNNDGLPYSSYPAAFESVISVGAHAEDQTLYDYSGGKSNGGADILAPGARVYSVKPDNSAWWVWGTSFAVPNASGLVALQLQFARQNNMELNNAYLWETLRHSAIDLGIDPVWQGKGKIWAARTDANDPNIGAIDLTAANWPIDYSLEFSNYNFIDSNIPVYYIGSDVNQTITLTNITDILGNGVETIEDLTISIEQVYFNEPNEPALPGDSQEVFPTISRLCPGDANSVQVGLAYTIPPDTVPGLVQTRVSFEFNFVGNSRIIKVSYPAFNSKWYAAIPADLNLNNTVDMTDMSIFAKRWHGSACLDPDYCQRADIDRSGKVDWNDLSLLAANWLEN